MSAQKLKLSILEIINKENDEVVLRAIKDVVESIVSIKKKQVVGYAVNGEPITGEELEKSVLTASENAKKGNLVSQEVLLEQMKNW